VMVFVVLAISISRNAQTIIRLVELIFVSFSSDGPYYLFDSM
jgi:hypothetical protein